MPVASEPLAARIERAECRLLVDACARTRERVGDAVFATPIAGGLAAFTEPGSPLNKIAGLGFAGVPDAGALDRLEAAYLMREVPVQAEVATLADPGVVRILSARGYALVGFEHVLGRGLPLDVSPVSPDVGVEPSSPAQFEAWLDVVVSGFAVPDTQGVASHEHFDDEVLRRTMREFSRADGILRYVAWRAGELAGGGSMRMHEGVAQLCGAATLSAHRGRGVQKALILGRLDDAARHGCDIAVVTTQPGSTSQQNMQRLGFEVLYARAILVKPLP